ncbi:heavy metal sensor histidine kinase [Achromobacter anxifer]
MIASLAARLTLMFFVCVTLTASVCSPLLLSALRISLQQQMERELDLRHSFQDPLLIWRQSSSTWHDVLFTHGNLASNGSLNAQHWTISDDPLYSHGGAPPKGVAWSQVPDGFSILPGEDDCCPLNVLITTIPPTGIRPAVRSVISLDSTPYMKTLDDFALVLTVISTAGLLLMTLLGYFIARVSLSPGRHLGDQARELTPGNSGQRLRLERLPTEIKDLATSFNGVLDRQEAAWRQLESFNANVAHELRTPLTNLIGQTQLGLADGGTRRDFKELLLSNLEELERMASIVNDMLFLSHAQVGQMAVDLSDASLREEAAKTVEYLEPLFTEKQLVIELEGEVRMRADRRLFHRALANLLENAACHAYPRTRISVRLEEIDGFAHVGVANCGTPVDQQTLPRLFERFFRAQAARSHSDKHHGLGLAIVKAVAAVHRGDVFACSADGVNIFGFTMAVLPTATTIARDAHNNIKERLPARLQT